MNNDDILGLLDLSGLQREFNRSFEDMTNNFDELLESTTKMETSARNDYHEKQMRNLYDLSNEMDEMANFAEEYLGELDEDLNDILLEDRRKDLRKFDTIHRRVMKKNQRRSDDFFENIGEEFETIQDRFGNISEIVTALGVANLTSGVTEDLFGSVEFARSIQAGLGLSTDEEIKAFESILEGAVSDIKDYGGIISRTDLYEAIAIAVNEFGIRDHDEAVDVGYELSRFQKSLGIDSTTFEPLYDLIAKGGYDTSMLEGIGDDLKKVSTEYRVNPEDILSNLEGQYSEIYRLAGTDSDVAEALTERLITAITVAEDQKIDSGIMFEVMDDIRNQGYSSALAGSQVDQIAIRDSLLVGEFDDAASAILEGIGQSVVNYSDDPVQLKAMSDMWGIDIDDLSGIGIAYEKNRHVFSDLKEAIIGDLEDSFGAIDKDLKEIQYKNPFDKMISKLGLTEIGNKLASGIESLGLDLSTMLQLSLGLQGVKSIGNIGKGIFQRVTGKTIAAGGAKEAGKGLIGKGLSALGTGATNFLGGTAINLGAGVTATGATMSTAGLAATGASAIGGGLLGGAGIVSGIKDLVQSRKIEDEKERQDKQFAGGTKLGMVGTGAAAGAAIGSFVPVVGTAVGGLVGAGIGGIGALASGTKVGKWGSDKWDGIKKWGSGLFSKEDKDKEERLVEETYDHKLDSETDIIKESLVDTHDEKLEVVNDLSLHGAEVTAESLSESYEESFRYKTDKELDLLKLLVDEEYKMKTSKKWKDLAKSGGPGTQTLSRAGFGFSPTSEVDTGGRGVYSTSTDSGSSGRGASSRSVDSDGNIITKIGRGIKSIFGFGSHRSGLDRVPHDGYGAILHKDETVLNKTEADNYHRDKQAKSSMSWMKDKIKDAVTEAKSFDYRSAVAQAMMGYSGGVEGTGSSAGNVSAGNVSADADSIWKALRDSGMTKAGAAGMMGNLQAESNLRPNNLQQSAERRLNMTDESYTSGVDQGSYTNFVNDSAGYGLAQWTYHSRKRNLLNSAKSKGTSIADTGMQLDFLVNELKNSYSGVWNVLRSTNSLREASNKVLHDFESPANQSASVQNARASMSQNFLNSLNSYEVGNDMVQESQVALIHKGEMIVPADKNPLKGGSTSVPMNDNGEVVQVLKWGFEYLANKIESNGKKSEPQPKAEPRKREFTSEHLLQIGGRF